MEYIWMIGQVFTTILELGMFLVLIGVLIELISPGEVEIAARIFDAIIGDVYDDEEEL